MILLWSQRVDKCPQIYFLLEVSVLRDNCPYNPPDNALEALARCLYPAILSYFESEEGQREFKEWKQSRLDAEQRPEKSGADSGDAASA